ncbi:NHL repeat-containing protein [Robiginitalea myxolifaciens]|nr:NHL repeat-containing protein [Robiginitalea myxolifaciens]
MKNLKKSSLAILLPGLLFFGLMGCQQEDVPHEWQLVRTIALDSINPIGLAESNGKIWLSDGDHNRVVLYDLTSGPVRVVDGLDRPMHIAAVSESLFVPQYGNDKVEEIGATGRKEMILPDSLDAPAGVDVLGNQQAIADFYNNRILFFDGNEWIVFGKEGKAAGEFYYPTDVQLTETEIYVADAYNHRIQVFDKAGKPLRMFGKEDKMNATTGIFVGPEAVFATDFENDRVLVYSPGGERLQILEEGIEKPTDMIQLQDKLYIANYRKAELLEYGWLPVKTTPEKQ